MYQINFKTYYSIQHLKSSYLLIEECNKIDSSEISLLEGRDKSDLISKNIAFATGAIFSTIAFSEACINEILSDISENADRIKSIPNSNKSVIKTIWDKEGRDSLERRSTLKKYQKTLELLDKNKFDEGSDLFENMSLLIELRNTLVHFKPEWNSIHSPHLEQNENQHILASKLEGKFELSSFYKKSGNPFFPDKCMGYGCTKWALKSVLLFADELHRRIEIKPIYDHVRIK